MPARTQAKKPTNRCKRGNKHYILADANGIPLSDTLTGANRHDVTQLLPLIDGIPSVDGKPGHPKNHPDDVDADRAYESEPHREELRKGGIEPRLAPQLPPPPNPLSPQRQNPSRIPQER